jgi:hypothetical protein
MLPALTAFLINGLVRKMCHAGGDDLRGLEDKVFA